MSKPKKEIQIDKQTDEIKQDAALKEAEASKQAVEKQAVADKSAEEQQIQAAEEQVVAEKVSEEKAESEQVVETKAESEQAAEAKADEAVEAKADGTVEQAEEAKNGEAGEQAAEAKAEQAAEAKEGEAGEQAAEAKEGEEGEVAPRVEQADAASEAEKPEEETPLLRVINLKEWFPIKQSFNKAKSVYLKAVDGVSFDLKQGKTIGIVGESGCGKTTLGRTILRLYTPTDGQIIFEGKHIEKLKGEELRRMRPHFQMIFQDPYASLSPRLTVGEIVGEAVKTHKIVPKEDYKDYVVDIMLKCGLQPHYFERYPHEFSGGQRQRICIAKALALKPKLVICDEPVSALDVSIQAQVINLFKDLQESDNLAYIFISHDLSVVEHISDEVGVMYLGNMVEFGSKEAIFSNPMHPYTEALFSAVPIPDPDTKLKRIILQGDIPSPAHPPKGCKFHTRCSKCMDICSEVEPEFKDYGGGHFVACHLYQ